VGKVHFYIPQQNAETDKGEVLYRARITHITIHLTGKYLRAGFIGFVFQQFHLIPYLTVLENIMTPSLALNKIMTENEPKSF
jgi:putative ABC transport system ATP-binding protein